MTVKQSAINLVNAMTKSKIKALLEAIDNGLANEELRPYAVARLESLTPKSNPLYPEQDALTRLIEKRDALNEQIKAHIATAKEGNYAFKTDKARLQNTGRTSRSGGSGSGKRGNAGDLVITVNGEDFTSWKAVCDHIYPSLVADKAARGVEQRNIGWRAEAYKKVAANDIPVTMTFKSALKFATYEDNGWLPESFEIVKDF